MSIRSSCLLAAAFTVVVSGSAGATIISTYTDRTAWEDALSDAVFVEEGFSTDTSTFAADSSGNPAGLVTVDVLGGGTDPGPTGLTGSGFFQSEVDSDGADALGVRFNFLPAIGIGLLGFQNDSATNAGGLNLVELGLMVDGSNFLLTDLLGLTDSTTATGNLGNQLSNGAIPFIGFLFDAPVGNFSIVHADQLYGDGVSGNSEEYYLDGLVLARQTETATVPEPATLLLFGVGLAGLVLRRRGKSIGMT